MRVVKSLWSFICEVASEWDKHRVGGLAAEIAFFAVLGMFPAFIALAAGLGEINDLLGEDVSLEAEHWVLERLDDVLGVNNNLTDTVNDLFSGANPSVLTAGALLSVYASSRGFTAVVRALDIAYDHEHRRGFLATRLVGLGLALMTIVVAVLVLTVIVVGPLFGEGDDLADRFGFGKYFATGWDWFRWPLVALILVAWAASLFHIGPNHRSPWRWELPGAVLSSAWWLVVSVGFSRYLELAADGANAVFGLLGGALSLLFWLYLMAMGLLLGAEVNGVLGRRAGIVTSGPKSIPVQDRYRLARRRLVERQLALAERQKAIERRAALEAEEADIALDGSTEE